MVFSRGGEKCSGTCCGNVSELDWSVRSNLLYHALTTETILKFCDSDTNLFYPMSAFMKPCLLSLSDCVIGKTIYCELRQSQSHNVIFAVTLWAERYCPGMCSSYNVLFLCWPWLLGSRLKGRVPTSTLTSTKFILYVKIRKMNRI